MALPTDIPCLFNFLKLIEEDLQSNVNNIMKFTKDCIKVEDNDQIMYLL